MNLLNNQSFFVANKVCNGLLREGVLALIDLDEHQSRTSVHVQNLLEEFQVPFLNAFWPKNRIAFSDLEAPPKFSINIHPDWFEFSKALTDLVVHFKWQSFVYIHEKYSG